MSHRRGARRRSTETTNAKSPGGVRPARRGVVTYPSRWQLQRTCRGVLAPNRLAVRAARRSGRTSGNQRLRSKTTPIPIRATDPCCSGRWGRHTGRSQEAGSAMTALPSIGDVHMLSSMVFYDGDGAEHRPVVAVRASPTLSTTSPSSSDPPRPTTSLGSPPPADPSQGLDNDGQWVLDFRRSVRWNQLAASLIRHFGRLSTTPTSSPLSPCGRTHERRLDRTSRHPTLRASDCGAPLRERGRGPQGSPVSTAGDGDTDLSALSHRLALRDLGSRHEPNRAEPT